MQIQPAYFPEAPGPPKQTKKKKKKGKVFLQFATFLEILELDLVKPRCWSVNLYDIYWTDIFLFLLVIVIVN